MESMEMSYGRRMVRHMELDFVKIFSSEKKIQIQDIMQKTMEVYISGQMMEFMDKNCGNSILVNFKPLN